MATMTTSPAANPVWRRYQQLRRRPLGQALFSWLVCRRSPYFRTIRPRVLGLQPGRCLVAMPKRRAVYNHLNTIHALAIGNLCELAAGLLMEVTTPPNLRWLPKGMTIEYLRKAETELIAIAELPADISLQAATEAPVTVAVRDRRGEIVVRAVIRMWLSARPSAPATSTANGRGAAP